MMIRNLILFLVFATIAKAGWSQANTYPWPNSGHIGIGTDQPTQPLDVRGQIYTTGSIVVDGGDVVIKRTSTPYGYVVRPNTTGYKKLQFAVEGGGPLEELYVNSTQSFFSGQVDIGGIDPTKYGALQIARPAAATDNKYHISFIRSGTSVAGMGYATGTDVLGIWQSPNTAANPPLMSFTSDQKVGIGTVTPSERFTIGTANGNITIGDRQFVGYNGVWLNGSTAALDYNFISSVNDNNLYINRPVNAAIYFRMQNSTQAVIASNGNMGIGTDKVFDVNYKLFVETGIRTRKIKVDQSAWPDYVFEKEYSLPTLEQVEKFINDHKHLPGVPSAKEIEKEGLNLGDNQALLLQKIEELTLYVIELKKKNEQQDIEIEKLKKRKRNK